MIGDVLTSSVLCEAIKLRFRESEVHYLINSHTIAVVENNPYIDQIVLFTPEMEKNKKARYKLVQFLKSQEYDTVIDVYSKLGSAKFTNSTKAAVRVGYHKWYTKWGYTHTFAYDKKPKTEAGLAIENRMKLLAPIASDFPPFLKPKIYLSKEEVLNAQNTLIENGIQTSNPILMVSLLGSSNDKTYPLPYMAILLDHIASNKNIQLLLNYIPKQQAKVDELLGLVKEETKKQIYSSIYGKSLREFLALTSQCTLMIGNEGGAINMAKALEIPTFSIFSPWITREAWGLFENKNNRSFHLKDIHPEIYENTILKKIRKDTPHFYDLMKPEIIGKSLGQFIKSQLH